MATLLSPYRRVLRLPGALAFSIGGLVARMPMAMVSLGIVLLVSTRSGSYSLAGTVAAAFLVANALLAIPQARLIDRLGQGRVLPTAALVFAGGLLAMMACVELDYPTPWPHLAAVVSGAALPQIGSSVRARWSHLVGDRRDLHTAYSFESVVDEAVFIAGPILVTALATSWDPVAGLAAAIIAGVGGTLFLSAQRATEPPGHPRVAVVDDGPRMPWRTVLPLAVVALALGSLFGSAEVTTVAFAEERDAAGLTGVLLALWALGSLLAGVITGAVHWSRGPAVRLKLGTAALAAGMAPLGLIGPVWLMGAALFLAGFAIAPSLIATLSLVEQSVPAARLTEGMAFIHTGLAAGLAPGAALGGVVVDAAGASPAYLVSAGAGVIAALAAQTLPRPRSLVEP